jgi:hypothetical protein
MLTCVNKTWTVLSNTPCHGEKWQEICSKCFFFNFLKLFKCLRRKSFMQVFHPVPLAFGSCPLREMSCNWSRRLSSDGFDSSVSSGRLSRTLDTTEIHCCVGMASSSFHVGPRLPKYTSPSGESAFSIRCPKKQNCRESWKFVAFLNEKSV